MGFQIAPDSEGNVLRLSGELDIAGADALLEQVESVAGRNGSPSVHVDLAELTFIDSSGIRALITASRRIGGRKMILLSPTPSVAKILDIVRVDRARRKAERLFGLEQFRLAGARGAREQQ